MGEKEIQMGNKTFFLHADFGQQEESQVLGKR